MPSALKPLTLAQQNFIETLNHGPQMLDPDLFDGPVERVMLGLKAHANTISHARLIALEETFPMTRDAIGHAQFNDLCREYIELDHVKANDNAQLGMYFAQFIDERCDPQITDLSHIEWSWLESYNAADAQPLSLEQLSEFDEEKLISQNVVWHPSVQLISLNAPLAQPLEQLQGIVIDPISILITRPDVEVKLLPLDQITTKILEKAKLKTEMGNLLELASELGDKDNPLQPILSIIGAGALTCIGP